MHPRAVTATPSASSWGRDQNQPHPCGAKPNRMHPSDFLLFEEAGSFLALEDDPTSPEVDPTYYDPEGDILLLEAILNSEPLPPLQGNYFPDTRKDLKICEANNENSSVNEPPEVELKDLPPHLEYEFLEGDDKLPVIIAKDLKNKEKAALIEVLKSHKRAIAWKLSDIKGINPEFCTHKILMEEDYEPTVQHQRRVNPKIHDVIKKEVEKLLDAGLIYPISDSPWVSPVHCVPKKGGMTVVKNDENDLILTRLVTGWRVCIDYRKLNEATQKDHFPLPFMDQMLERLAGNQFYCFLDGQPLPFGFAMEPGLFQRVMDGNSSYEMIVITMEVLWIDFSVFGDYFSTCTFPFGQMLKRCNRPPIWFPKLGEKPRFMVKEGIVLDTKSPSRELRSDELKLSYRQLPHPNYCEEHLELEFDVVIRDKKGAENLAADHLSRLENPHQDKLKNKEITETFPLETLGSVAFRVDSTPWFADFANYHGEFSSSREISRSDNFLIGKLKSQLSGPLFTIVQVFRYGTVGYTKTPGQTSKLNGHRLKNYFRGEHPAMDIPDLHNLQGQTNFRELGSSLVNLNKRFVGGTHAYHSLYRSSMLA
ncbi:hypothetical protein Tco_1070257 [Tanacetum coccineum]|uniref:Reverse transcriptase domain-containing protein n=1 Tax=Tanacetum coccineum TaxID=301880 RepID=A0ABQ5HL81_9ASTR